MAATIFILNGSNLNRLGTRQPELYGTETLASLQQRCAGRAKELGLGLDFRQTNFEGEMVESVHEAIDNAAGIIMNPAGFTFQSVSVMDSLKMFEGPKIEIHISNVHKREDPIYHHSMMSKVVTAVIAGMGTDGYLHALDWMSTRVGQA